MDNTHDAKLNEERREVLQEVTNIGMGQAGDLLARVLGSFVELSIPRLIMVSPNSVTHSIEELVGNNSDVSAVRQAFLGHWHGEAIIIYDHNGCKELAELMGYPKELDANAEVELFLDVGNLLVGACLNGVGELLESQLKYSAPSMLANNVPIQELFADENLDWGSALLLEVNFHLENREFRSHLLVMLTEESLEVLCNDLDKFLEKMM